MTITVSIVEDHESTRKSLRALLAESGLKLLASYPTAEEALVGIPKNPPQVALVDINLPGMDGIECVRRLKANLPDLEVLMLTTYDETDLIFNSLRAGANGYVLKSAPAAELMHAIEQIHSGGSPMSMPIARKVVGYFSQIRKKNPEVEKLSKREYEVLSLLAEGYRYKEICAALNISMSTVRTHIRRMYQALQVESRTEATVKFLQRL
ncbi:MAG TPA: response regulator transcription factor [Pirellulales bacterium]|jgi:DNA-binding NarL/FixJ family response regulator|nr:response regulator transcription factor [Pirellulales bacterium]